MNVRTHTLRRHPTAVGRLDDALVRLRSLVPRGRALVGLDLARGAWIVMAGQVRFSWMPRVFLEVIPTVPVVVLYLPLRWIAMRGCRVLQGAAADAGLAPLGVRVTAPGR